MWKLERTKVMDNWEYQNAYKGTDGFYYAGKWNHYMAGKEDSNDYGVTFNNGDVYRREDLTIKPTPEDSSGDKTKANSTTVKGGVFYNEMEVDSINLDFRAEIRKKFATDWDLGQPINGSIRYVFAAEGWDADNGADKRILSNLDFDVPFKSRDESQVADVLWTRIESDPIKDLTYIGKAGHDAYNSVRQITLNFNSDNTAKIASGDNKGHYVYRPYCIFYTGPENVDYRTDSDGVLIRRSKPVVINLNAALNAIIYVPESPVIINGNGHKWTGFIIAKCFLRPVTGDEVKSGGSFELFDGFKTKNFVGDFETEGTDSKGNTVYVKATDLRTATEIGTGKEDLKKITASKTGNVSFVDESNLTKHIVISFTKDDFSACNTADKFYTRFASIINDTYKDKFKNFSGLTDEQITAVTFPTENYNFTSLTSATYYVATSDLLDKDPDGNPEVQKDKYVKVLLADGSAKFVDKTKLPYVKIRVNQEYFFVCVYDLRTAWPDGKFVDSNNKDVRIIDDSIAESEVTRTYKNDPNHNKATTTDADVFVNNEDKWYSSWGIATKLYNLHKINYLTGRLVFLEQNGVKYFVLDSEVAEQRDSLYHEITVNGETKYIKEGTEYYTRIDSNNDKNVTNYIILDKDGNILTRPITAPEVLGVNTVTKNNNLTTQLNDGNGSLELIEYWNKYTRATNSDEQPGDDGTTNGEQFVGQDANRAHKDYRIPALERVYYATLNDGFNLSSASGYSYFQIPSLWRANYTYLNVDEINHTVNGKPSNNWHVVDMFFTTIRAGWVD